MNRYILILFISLIYSANVLSQNLLIKGGWLFTGLENSAEKNPGLLIRDGKFVGTGSGLDAVNFEVLELSSDDYILPGIIDMHAHYKVHIGGQEREDTVALPKIYLANGVTSTFTAGELEPNKILQLKSRINEGVQAGPRIYNTGPYFGKDAASKNEYWTEDISTEEIIELVDAWSAKGIAGIKVKKVSRDQLATIVKQAHKHGLTVTGHFDSGFDNTLNPKEAIDLGVDRVEHFLGGELLPDTIGAYPGLAAMNPNDPQLDKIIQQYIDKGVYYSPTISAYGMVAGTDDMALEDWVDQLQFFTPYSKKAIQSQLSGLPFHIMFGKIYENKKIEIKRFYDGGGTYLIVLGTDRQHRNGDIGGFAAHKEMKVLSEAGIPNYDVIRIASINGAKALGLEESLGTIEIGKWADCYIVKGNPIEKIENTRSVHTVIKGGVIYDSKELLIDVAGKIGPSGAYDWK